MIRIPCRMIRGIRSGFAAIGRATTRAFRRNGVTQAPRAAREADLRAMLDCAAVGLTVFDPVARRILQVNPEYCRMTGRSEAALLGGLFLTDLTHPDDVAGDARWDAPAEIGARIDYDKRLLKPDGTVVWIHASGCVLAVGADGRPHRILATVQDCTERMGAEAALRTSDELLRLSLEAGRIGTYRRDFRTQMIQCGARTRAMLGLSAEDVPLAVADWAAIIVPEDRLRLLRTIAVAHAARQETLESDYRFMHPVDGLRHVETRNRTTYDKDGTPLYWIGVVIDVTERRRIEARVAHLAHHDPLTGLANRGLFGVRLDEALVRAGRGEPFALLCLDLDHFKEVNDTLGHPTGDALLQAVTERLNVLIQPPDTAARLGGDEFAVIQSGLQRPEDAIALADRIIAALQAPFDLSGKRVVIGASVGIAIAPDGGMDARTLLMRADVALYASKAEGRGCRRRFESHMDAARQIRRSLELDLREALERGEFELFYQPIVNLALRRVCVFEALLRWHHPSRGLMSPAAFIPLAEATGLLVPIGGWAMRQACAEAGSWTDGTRVAVNLSARQLSSATLVDTVTDALRQSNLDPCRLELEITEAAVLRDSEAKLAKLQRISALGATIATDDFGTGYASLGCLLRFPFNKVKIDRSFTSHVAGSPESATIVRAVIGLCSSLGMETTADGVETSEQFDTLARIGCTEAQGYYLGRPQPAVAIPAMRAQIEDLFRPGDAAERQLDKRPSEGRPACDPGALASDYPRLTARTG
jgi:diguanylate cyclase (GGDEF)-like protein/PAS domain S-box-containing protein